jgi:hypothetical protein
LEVWRSRNAKESLTSSFASFGSEAPTGKVYSAGRHARRSLQRDKSTNLFDGPLRCTCSRYIGCIYGSFVHGESCA